MISIEGVDFSKILTRYDLQLENDLSPEEMAKKMLPTDPILKNVAEKVMYMKFKEVMPAVSDALAMGVDPLVIINDGLVAGMDIVAKLYAEHVYYLPEIMMAAKTMEMGIKVAEKKIQGGRQTKALCVMHAVEGDPHDIGKNIAAVMMRAANYTVVDMGRDVPITDVVAKVQELKDAGTPPIFVSGTALMTTTMSAFPKEAAEFVKKGWNIPLMGCGGAVNREFANSYDLGIYSKKAPQTPLIAQKILDGYDWKKIREDWDNIVGGN